MKTLLIYTDNGIIECPTNLDTIDSDILNNAIKEQDTLVINTNRNSTMYINTYNVVAIEVINNNIPPIKK